MTPEDLAASRVIDAAREELGMSKAELARRSGISERTVKYYLAGERAMTVGAFRALHTVLGISREEAARRITEALVAPDDTTE